MQDTTFAIAQALIRIEDEFVAMPGMRLTASQLNRLINLPPDVCESALKVLTRSGFLKVIDGTFLRRGRGERRRVVVA